MADSDCSDLVGAVEKPQESRKGVRGRKPMLYDPAVGDRICELLMEPLSLRKICERDDMPSKATVLKWLGSNPEFAAQYARAREMQADALFDETLDIADDATNDWMKRNDPKNPGWVENGEALQRSRLRIDARKWMAGKLRPKKYGDKTVLSNDPENPLPDAGVKIDVVALAEQLRNQAALGKTDRG